jgi:putative ABC transport system substrate-binding protein
MKSRIVWLLLAVAVLAGGTYLLVGRQAKTPEQGPVIGIAYTAPIPVINDIIAGFEARVRKDFPTARFIVAHADGREEQYQSTVSAILAKRPDLMAPITTPISKLAVQGARGSVPIVFMGVTDPVGAGVAKSIDRPELATGSSDLCPFDALLTVVRTALPSAKTIGLPYDPTDQPAVFGRQQLLGLAGKHGFKVIDTQVTSADELNASVGGLAARTDAILIAADNLMMSNPTVVVNAARARGKPTFACDDASVKAGAVGGVSVSYRQIGELAGDRAVQVLKGTSPGTIPVGVLHTGSMIFNLKSACASRIALPPLPAGATALDPSTTCEEAPAR